MGIFKLMGMADVKVLVPIILSLSLINLLYFLIIFSSIGLVYGILKWKDKNNVPAFVPVTIAYTVVMVFI
jgi:hypothetical protein